MKNQLVWISIRNKLHWIQGQTVNEDIREGKESKVFKTGEDVSKDRVSPKSIKKGVTCSDPNLLCQILQKSQQAGSSSQSTLKANCMSVGLELHGETPADGNCLFEAVSSQLQRLNCIVQKTPQHLRQEVVAFMRTNRVIQASEGTIDLDSFIYNESFDDYCSRMARDSEWADHVVVVAMARMLQMDIMIVTSSPLSGPENIIVWAVGKNAFQGDPILLGHVWESHYMSLQPIAPVVLDQDLAGHSKQTQPDVHTPVPTAQNMQIPTSGSTSSTAVGPIQAPTTGCIPSLTYVPTSTTVLLTTTSVLTPSTTNGSKLCPSFTSTSAVMQAALAVPTTAKIVLATIPGLKPTTITGSTLCPTSTSTTTVMQALAAASTSNTLQSPSSSSTTNAMQAPASGFTAINILQSTASVSNPSTTVALMPLLSSCYTASGLSQPHASISIPSTTAVVMQTPSVDDTDRFMHIACLLVNVGSKVLRRLLLYHTVTPTCTLDQYLANKRIDIDNLRKKRILNKSQMDILFPPGGTTNLGDYDITLLSALLTNIVSNISLQQLNMIQFLRDKRNEIFAHAKSVTVNANDYLTFWNDICRELEALSKQCGDPDFENEISKEIQGIQVSTVQGTSLLDTLQTHPRRVETLEKLVQDLISCLAQKLNQESDDSET
ncbi:hypothetical protein ACJMK2_001719 [Sinanodonta woodiana]|uniref:OTU domain-containing protein n=1 Tax=Sinanodonta woodiana TaxID=1069815 RepID=A0ABD3XWH2_SINWO